MNYVITSDSTFKQFNYFSQCSVPKRKMTCSQRDLLFRQIVLGLLYTIPVVVVLVLNICLSIVEVARCWWNGVLGSRASCHLLQCLQYFCLPNFCLPHLPSIPKFGNSETFVRIRRLPQTVSSQPAGQPVQDLYERDQRESQHEAK